MQQTDQCQRFIFTDSDIRGELVTLTSSYSEVLANRAYPESVASLLGEFLAASVLLSTTIKFSGRLVLQARSKGKVPLIMAECSSAQILRGIARFNNEPPGDDFQTLLTSGTLAITIERERGEPYQGIVPLQQNSLAGCLQDYFALSEQLPSLLFLVAGQQRCAGLLLQQLPARAGSDNEQRMEEWSTVSQLAATLSMEELLGLGSEELLHRLFHQHSVKLFPARTVQYGCSCTRERTANALHALGAEDVLALIAERGCVEIHCEFCGKEYRYDADEMKLLFEIPPAKKQH